VTPTLTGRLVPAAACAAALLLAGCSDADPAAEPAPAAPSSTTAVPTETPPTVSTSEPPPPAKPLRQVPRDVLAISVDGLTPAVFDELTPEQVPSFTRLFNEGAVTMNARTEVEMTVTLPNHTGMLTGRRIDPDRGGHGVTWNQEVGDAIVPGADHEGVASVFDVVHDAGGTSALFAGKEKFVIYDRSWPDIDRFEVELDPDSLVDDVQADLSGAGRRFTFLHLALPDAAGHPTGWLSLAYRGAVLETDRLLGELLATIDATPRLKRRLVVVLTADHGGPRGEQEHDDAGNPANYTIPFVVWGRSIRPADLYALNPDLVDPGDAQPSYDGPQPVRNGDVANLVTDLLGLGPVPGSELDAAQDLDWR